ncbi:MAG: TerC/Alx family metal homeostasis membrane protein [Ignavibacteriae bacterium]|nr:TerC/Alx family metal homeostasis membrane protein [Ignavibacteriota bacterium]
MENIILFPFADYWHFYAGFTAFVLVMLAIDLGVFHRDAHEVSFKESLTWSVVWISFALIFNVLLYYFSQGIFESDARLTTLPGFNSELAAKQVALEFLTGFIVEKTLAIDNIFVFVVVFSFFAIPLKYQHRVLFFGIIGALIFRILFIAMGSILLSYQWIVVFFGIFLILTGGKIIFAPEKPIEPEKNPIINLFTKIFPVTPTIEGQKFFLRREQVLYATPLMVALLFIEVSDIIFAVDSVPAIFAITNEPLIVFTSNVFAILGLRAMYFMLAGVIHKFQYIKYGLGLVLVFVGLKMAWLNEAFGGKFPISWSLIIIIALIGSSIIYSLIKKKEK